MSNDELHKILQAQAKTHTLLESHVKLNDERYEYIKDRFDDHETRIRKGEGFRARLIGWAVGAGIISVSGAEIIKTKLGI
jgi:hypothetical protein